MRASIVLASALAALTANAAPTWPTLNVNSALPGSLDSVSDYFNLLAQKIAASKSMATAPVCDLSKASMPVAPTALPSPAAGLVLKHVAIGRGTQNYSCDTTNATAPPAQIGAMATLFNASCIASTYPDLLTMLPNMVLQFNLTEEEDPRLGPTNLAVSGQHFFTNTTTPFFNLDTPSMQLGEAPCNKTSQSAAPANAPKGQKGEGAVPWLYLTARAGATGNLQEVYRLETAGGSAPANCAGMPATFQVQYSAQYWFWEKPE